METNKTVGTVFLDQNVTYLEVRNELMCFNSSATILETTFLTSKHFNKNFSRYGWQSHICSFS